jgi:transcriptional regulator with XRE-family HTH domain
MSMNRRTDPKFVRSYQRGMLRSTFVSLFWSVFRHRKEQDGLTLQALAKAIPANKAEVSRWFNGDPNWTLNTIASIADALNVDLRVEAVDRKSGVVFTANGRQKTHPEGMRATGANVVVPTRVIRGPAESQKTSSAA